VRAGDATLGLYATSKPFVTQLNIERFIPKSVGVFVPLMIRELRILVKHTAPNMDQSGVLVKHSLSGPGNKAASKAERVKRKGAADVPSFVILITTLNGVRELDSIVPKLAMIELYAIVE
jgi:hypothetical protein